MTERSISSEELTEQLMDLGVQRGGVLLVHTSFRAVRPVENGPPGLIEALRNALGRTGTLVMPSWSDSNDEPFDPASSAAPADLGVVADVFWRLPDVARSDHPHAFAALGPRAEEIVRGPLPLPPHRLASPVGKVHDLDGQVLLLGVNHDADTTIHLAECMASVPYGIRKNCTVVEGGSPIRVEYVENDHCCERFVLVDGWLSAEQLQSEGPVGHAPARLTAARSIVRVALARLGLRPRRYDWADS